MKTAGAGDDDDSGVSWRIMKYQVAENMVLIIICADNMNS